MNVDPTSSRFCEVVAWNSLSDEEKKSGKWIELPSVANEPAKARRKSGIEDLYEDLQNESNRMERIESSVRALRPATRFDALGRPVP